MSPTSTGFENLGIVASLQQILTRLNYTTPTPIQAQAIPIGIEGKDLIGIAQTGTGKTLAFAVPLIQRLAQIGGMGLILAPTRELAMQIEETLQKIGQFVDLRTALIIGGASMYQQLQAIKRGPHIIIATPGRCIDHMEQRTINLTSVSVLVLDEADRMLDMGFAPQIKRILEKVPKERQTMLFSATMPQEIVSIANSHMKLPVRVEIARSGSTAENVTQEAYVVKKEDKIRLLEKLLLEPYKTVLVFSRTKHGAKKIAKSLRDMGFSATEIHSNRTLAQRFAALQGFKTGKFRVLVATDIAARGIDVTGIDLVVNFDLPDVAEDYVHRIGRTARAGKKGHAISFVGPDQARDLRDIERLLRKPLPKSALPELPPHRATSPTVYQTPSRSSSPRPYAHAEPRGRSTATGRPSFHPKRFAARRFDHRAP